MTEEYAKQISHWTYEGEYSIYSFQPDEETLAELLDGSYFACTLGQELVGYFCFGASATIPTLPGSVSLPQGDFLDFGLGMRPDLCGQGRGKEFMQAGFCLESRNFMPRLTGLRWRPGTNGHSIFIRRWALQLPVR